MIRKIDLKENEVLNYNNCIYSDYKCNCTKDWKEHNKVIVYYLDKESCVKLLDEPTENIFDYSKTIYTFLNEKLKGSQKLLVAGGHTVINLKDRIEVIINNKPNCVAGNAATFRDINFIVNNSKIKDNYDSHIGIYPLGSLDNVINGYLVGNDFYKLNLPTILIFYDKKCY